MKPLPLVALVAAFAVSARAETRPELEREVVRLAAQRDAVLAERQQKAEQAAPLAEAIARSADPGARAGREATRRLRELDRVAERLDGLDARVRDVERRLARAAAAFEAQAERDEAALTERSRQASAAELAAELAALGDARRRVAALAQPQRFRPPLEVTFGALDGRGEIETKLRVIDGERARLAQRARELEREDALLAARLTARREWVRELGAARREGGGEIELLDRAHESAEGVTRDLVARLAAVADERTRLRQWHESLAERRREGEERLRTSSTRRVTP